MADVTYEHLPPERQHALICRRLRVAEEDHFRMVLQEEAPVDATPAMESVGRKKAKLEDTIDTLRAKRDQLETKDKALKAKRPF